jgi:hypothetical protein
MVKRNTRKLAMYCQLYVQISKQKELPCNYTGVPKICMVNKSISSQIQSKECDVCSKQRHLFILYEVGMEVPKWYCHETGFKKGPAKQNMCDT